MVEIEDAEITAARTRRLRFDWLLAIFRRPARVIRQVAAEEHPAWLLPLLALTLLTIASVLVAGPLRQEAARNATVELPENFQYMSPEQQQQFFQAQESKAGPTLAYVFPGLGALVGVWLGWFLLGGVLHLVLTLLGSRASNTVAFNLAAWSSVPFLVRLVVQIVAMLATRNLITTPGLAGFLPEDAAGFVAYLKGMLAQVDIYWIAQIVLLALAALSLPGLTRGKAIGGVLAAVLLLAVLSALPGFIAAQIGGLNSGGPMFFFF